MKRSYYPILAMFLIGTGSLNIRAAVGLLPEDKQPIVVAEGERNPFGKRGPKTPLKTEEDSESEEARIRGILGSLNAVGVGERDGKTTALLGSLVVIPGTELPPVLPDQKEVIRVLLVQKNVIELGFVDKDGNAETRKISVTIKTKPTVRYDLGVRPAKQAPDESSGALGGTIQVHENSKPQP